MNKDKKTYKDVIKVLKTAKKEKQFIKLSHFVDDYAWEDEDRKMYLLGLIQGLILKINKSKTRKVLNVIKTL
jgi:hypothetical protein